MINTYFMDIQAINSITPITLSKVHEVLTSNKISQRQKTDFIRYYKTQIQQALDVKLTGTEYQWIMKSRPLQKFKPIKNSFTKRGDKILLAKMLGIEPTEVDDYIENVEEALTDIDKLSFLPKDKLDSIKTYVYRHGSKDDIVTFLDYELRESKDILSTLYKTLEYHTGGLADYFIRPIHKMSNLTMIKLYNVIDKNIENAYKSGSIDEKQKGEIARWALIRIYQIQNNSQFINAVKTFKVLNQ